MMSCHTLVFPYIFCILGQGRCAMEDLEAGETIDWATAEALAFGTLLLEGNHVRNLPAFHLVSLVCRLS